MRVEIGSQWDVSWCSRSYVMREGQRRVDDDDDDDDDVDDDDDDDDN